MPIQEDLQAFLAEWHDPSPFLEVQTSGSTGTPKRMRVRKDRMLNSARLTCDYLGLKKGDKALLCMPLRYIAGKMMVVRSLYAGLDLEVREPSGHPLADWGDTPLRFAAMIPLQVYNTLRVPEERKRLEQTDILIIGGGAIDAALEQEIRQMPNTVYSTYGMTETLSHVALRRLNGPEASPYYHPFPSVTLSLSPDNTLVIDAPLVCDERLVEISDVRFVFSAERRVESRFIVVFRNEIRLYFYACFRGKFFKHIFEFVLVCLRIRLIRPKLQRRAAAFLVAAEQTDRAEENDGAQ